MSLLTILDAELAFGLQPLLDRASLTVNAGDRIGLIGRNGTGKSSLLNAIAGRIELDDGEIKKKGRAVDRDGRARARVTARADVAREPCAAWRNRNSCVVQTTIANAGASRHD